MRGKGKMRKRKNVQQAVILAGGYGKRLAPFTEHDPKPMYPLTGNRFWATCSDRLKVLE